MDFSCSQVSSLLQFYIDDKLNCQIKEKLEYHLEKCSSCREKYKTMLNIKLEFIQAQEYLESIKSEDDFIAVFTAEPNYAMVKNLSAYSDNELSDDESLKVKKYIIKNLSGRQALEELYELRNVMRKSFKKYEISLKDDYSKKVLNKMRIDEELKLGGSKLKVASILIFLLTSVTVGLIYLITNFLV